MAPQNQIQSSSGFTYKLNNFFSCVNTAEAPHEFHNLMNFIGQCKLVYVMNEAIVLICEVIEKVWTTAAYNSTDRVLTFNLKGNSYSINGDILSSCLKFPAKTQNVALTKTKIRSMLVEINYTEPEANLGIILRNNLRKE